MALPPWGRRDRGPTLAAGYLFWLRDSSLVAVDNVDVVGVTSGDRDADRRRADPAAEQQTTLHADPARSSAARPFPTVAAVSVDPNFPHGMRIEVTERPPALLVSRRREQVPAAADGTLLPGVEVGRGRTRCRCSRLEQGPGGRQARRRPPRPGARARRRAGTAPAADREGRLQRRLRDRGDAARRDPGALRQRGARRREKWAAAAAVLADPKLDGLTYVDVRVPERAAAGGASPSPDAIDSQP